MSAIGTIIAIDEFLSNPDVHYYDLHELHHGEVVVVPPPSNLHVSLQRRIENLLTPLLTGTEFTVWREFYYVLPTNARRADVAVVLETRRGDQDSIFRGGPDVVVEILSPSNTALDLDRLRVECFDAGTREFWIINPVLKTVTVYRSPSFVSLYGAGHLIGLKELGVARSLAVETIFE